MTDVTIIGAGPYGLSIAANLRRRDVPFRIFGRSMAMWTDHMPRGMVLKSDGFATNLGGMPLTLRKFCEQSGRSYGDLGHRTPIADMIAYAQAFQQAYVGDVEDDQVETITSYNAGFQVRLRTGDEFFSSRVIVATGLMGFQRLPEIPGMDPERMTHASAHNDLLSFANKRVIVIGAGQSAFETAALLHEQGARQVTVLNRRQAYWFNPDGESVPNAWTRIRHPNFGLGPGWKTWLWSEAPTLFYHLPPGLRLSKAFSTFGPAGSGWLKDRVIGVSGIEIRIVQINRAECSADGVEIFGSDPNGRMQSYSADHVIAATGYKADMRRIPFLEPLLNAKRNDMEWLADGLPRLNNRFETSIPGLHTAGFMSAGCWGPSMRFIYGTNFAAPHIAHHLVEARKTSVSAASVYAKQPA